MQSRLYDVYRQKQLPRKIDVQRKFETLYVENLNLVIILFNINSRFDVTSGYVKSGFHCITLVISYFDTKLRMLHTYYLGFPE